MSSKKSLPNIPGRKAQRAKKSRKPLRKSKIEPSTIRNRQRRRMLVVRNKMAKNREQVAFKTQMRKLEASGQQFTKFAPVSQEEKAFSVFNLSKKKSGANLAEPENLEDIEQLEDEEDFDQIDDPQKPGHSDQPEKTKRPEEQVETDGIQNESEQADPVKPEAADDGSESIDLEDDLEREQAHDEFAEFISGAREPKIFLTTMFRTATRKSFQLLQGTANSRNKKFTPEKLLLPSQVVYRF